MNFFKRSQDKKQPRKPLTAEDHIQMGIDLKRAGNLTAARQAYWKAISLEPSNVMTYYSLGKTAYLMANRHEAVCSFLASIHISLSNMILSITVFKNQVFLAQRKMLEMHLSEEYLAKLRSYHPFADLLFLDHQIPLHLAHAYVDLAPDLPENIKFKLREMISRYRDAISGRPSSDIDDEEEEHYLPIGRAIALTYLRWKLLTTDVDIRKYYQLKDF